MEASGSVDMYRYTYLWIRRSKNIRIRKIALWGFHSATSLIYPMIASPVDHAAFILYWAGLVCLGLPLCTLGGVRGLKAYYLCTVLYM
jgi:hypothetical protein